MSSSALGVGTPRAHSNASAASNASSQHSQHSQRDAILASMLTGAPSTGGAPTAAASAAHSGRTAALRESCRGLLQEIRGELVVDSRWHLPFPSVPAAQLLYVPESVRDTFACPTRDIMHSDIDAMQIGILDRLNVTMPPGDPHEVKRIRDAVAEAEHHYEGKVAEQRALGLAVDPIPPLTERYNLLDQEDADLVEEDLGVRPLDEADLPSATLLKNPIYTELGRTPVDVRAAQRLQAVFSRVTQQQEVFQSQASIVAGGGGDSQSGGGGMTMMLPGRTQQTQGAEHASADEKWVKQVHQSFKNARQIDTIFDQYADRAALTLLGLTADADKLPAVGGEAFRAAQAAVRRFACFFVETVSAAHDAWPGFAKDVTQKVRQVVSSSVLPEEASAQLYERWNTDAIFAENNNNNTNSGGNNNDDDDPFAAAASNAGVGVQEGGEKITNEEVDTIRFDLMPRVRTLLSEWGDVFQAHHNALGSDTAHLFDLDDDSIIHITGDGASGSHNQSAAYKKENSGIGAYIRLLLRDVNPQPGMLHGKLALQHPEHRRDVPIAVLPLVSMDPGFSTDSPFDMRRLQARVFQGVAQNEESRAEQLRRNLPTVLFDDGAMLLRPDGVALAAQKNRGAAAAAAGGGGGGEDRNDPATYLPESTKFEMFREDEDDHSMYVLKVGKESAQFGRIPKVVEYRRQAGTEIQASALARNMVIWDNDDDDDDHAQQHGAGGKRNQDDDDDLGSLLQ